MSKEELSEREVHDLVQILGTPESQRDDYQRYLVEKALNFINPDWREITKKLGM